MSETAKKKKMPAEALIKLAVSVLEDLKAEAITCLDVRHLTSVTDAMIIASGRSARHVRAIADALVERSKKNHYRPVGIEGAGGGEWVLIDLVDVVVHVMLLTVRKFYELEKLWDIESVEDVEESL